ncbi:MAG: hypothetical protein AUJ52_00085 [Elusimicrobia bacterium CG1_02_63_36]|nr:MAG: hypothetical protein AUJ52_00085 [Elusimicrobia bacterium CG1_02_63_36]PIP83997.1 MAG: hypothetical protein COR54_06440 [Elusimicrobia bacterium CG22_combo_CG10-13_8_21_14_all_63_91]PJA13577.1 MAG: hypothetical protein COX66_14530 [Elusimicrobia bacterium CG_4_10_14_0_2_um_filter_63_34]PJB23949.1 MAG: hypothetical protein CO113_16275 [Elusimicrobia bacterium CG_4_9_14_3_um_filter_62_55]
MSTRTIFSSLILTLILGGSARGAGLEGVKADAGVSFGAELGAALDAMKPKDILAEVKPCRIVDARFFMAPTLEQALGMLAPCASALGAKAGVSVRIENQTTPAGEAVPILEVRLGAGALAASSFRGDLEYSLRARRFLLLGFPVRVLRGDWKPL